MSGDYDICAEHPIDYECLQKKQSREVTLEEVYMNEASQTCAKEVTIILKGEDKTYKQKFLCYVPIEVSSNDPEIDRCIREAKTNFIGDPEEIQVRILLQV